MQRRLIHFLLVILLGLQSLNAMSASPLQSSLEHAVTEHCGGQGAMDVSLTDCCNDECTMSGCIVSCATYQSVFSIPVFSPTHLSVLSTDEFSEFVVKAVPNRTDTPLNPPPIV
jgi:hypothetical protein